LQKRNNFEFEIDDIESLQNAKIDNKLLERYFLQNQENSLFNKKMILDKHG
jgi:hypothetical protein